MRREATTGGTAARRGACFLRCGESIPKPPETMMTGHYVRSPDLDPELVMSLKLIVRTLPDRPNRWAWDLRDGRDGSWFESMLEFESHERARQSGLARIVELLESVRGTGPGALRQRLILREAA